MGVADADSWATDGHKWLLGPEGAGLFYMRREHLDLLKPLRIGWNSVQNPLDFDQMLAKNLLAELDTAKSRK